MKIVVTSLDQDKALRFCTGVLGFVKMIGVSRCPRGGPAAQGGVGT